MSDTTTSSDSSQLAEYIREERQLFEERDGEETDEFEQSRIKHYFRELYQRHLKFLSEKDRAYDEPPFVSSEMARHSIEEKPQTITITEALMKKIGRNDTSWKAKCKFWITNRSLIRTQVGEFRRYFLDEIKKKLVEGKTNIELFVFYYTFVVLSPNLCLVNSFFF